MYACIRMCFICPLQQMLMHGEFQGNRMSGIFILSVSYFLHTNTCISLIFTEYKKKRASVNWIVTLQPDSTKLAFYSMICFTRGYLFMGPEGKGPFLEFFSSSFLVEHYKIYITNAQHIANEPGIE